MGGNGELPGSQQPAGDYVGVEDEYICLAQETELMTLILANTQRMAEIGKAAGRNPPVVNGLNQVFATMSRSSHRPSQQNSQPQQVNGPNQAMSNRAPEASQPVRHLAKKASVHQRLGSQVIRENPRGGVFDRLEGGARGSDGREVS